MNAFLANLFVRVGARPRRKSARQVSAIGDIHSILATDRTLGRQPTRVSVSFPLNLAPNRTVAYRLWLSPGHRFLPLRNYDPLWPNFGRKTVAPSRS